MTADRLDITQRAIDDLVPYERNARKHPARQIAALRAGIKAFGFGTALAVWKDGMILAGHGRVEAARLEGYTELPCIDMSHLTEVQARAFILSDNKTSDMSTFDNEILNSELLDLGADADFPDLGFDLEALGFTASELRRRLPEEDGPGPGAAARAPVSTDPEIAATLGSKISEEGQLWLLGDHRLFCGDSTSPENWAAVMAGELADVLFSDPPYGVSYSEKAESMNARLKSGGGANEGKIENDTLNTTDLAVFLTAAFSGLRDVLKPSARFYICMPGGDKQHAMALAMRAARLWHRQSIAWVKNTIVMGRADYHYQHEVILTGDCGEEPPFYGIEGSSSIWNCPKPRASGLHPTMKPIALIERALHDSTEAGDIVIDGFGGSGSTLMACENHGRRARLIELSPKYCDVILRRWRLQTGEEPTLDGVKLCDIENNMNIDINPESDDHVEADGSIGGPSADNASGDS